MKTSSTWSFRSIVGKIVMGLVLAAMIGSIDVAPALGKDNRGKQVNRYQNRGDRGHYVYVQGRRVWRVYRPYGYRERVYVEPPVIYAPPRPPGFSIFFPPIFIHP